MQSFTEHGQSIINELAQRYGVSSDAVTHMLYAVLNGNGSMAQFSHPEFGGSGQWMQGGMTMVGDMFNQNLQATVSNLCGELANILNNQNPSLFNTGSSQSQYQGSNQSQYQGGGQSQYQGNGQQQNNGGFSQNSLFTSNPNQWWPGDLGSPSSSGAQNNIRYAYFPSTRRLAVEVNGQITVYDTLDHQIGGVSQQQGGNTSLSFSSQYGDVLASSLPVISIDGVEQQNANFVQQAQPAPEPGFIQQAQPVADPGFMQQTPDSNNMMEADIFATIERLADLKQKGILSDDEFTTKKAELLQRL